MELIKEKMTHADFLAQYNSGKITVGYDNSGALMAASAGLIYSNSVYFFYLSPIVLIASIVLSIVMHWWIFIPGILLSIFLGAQMKPCNIRALRKAVLTNEQIYDAAFNNGWIRVYKR